MNILSRLLNLGKSDPAPPYRVVYIYFNDSEIVVVPTESCNGMHLPRQPFRRFARSVDGDSLGASVIDCVSASESDTIREVCGRHLNKFFQFMHAVDWKGVESHWDHIQVLEWFSAEYEVYQFQRARSGGYVSDRKPCRVAAVSEATGRCICDIIKMAKREDYDDGGPSHT
jgi:hypothetical protein